MACGRHTIQNLSVYTLDGNNHLAEIESAGFEITLQTVDIGSAASSDELAKDVKRSASHDFTLKTGNGAGDVMSADEIATFTIDAVTMIGIAKSFTVSQQTKTVDGSGIGNLDTCPVAVRRKVTAQCRKMHAINVTIDDWMEMANSTTKSDRHVDISINFGANTITGPFMLQQCKHSLQEADMDMIDASFEKRGALTSPSSGTDIYNVAFAGDALVTVVATIDSFTFPAGANNGTQTYTATGVITNLTVSVEDGQIVKTTGTIEIQGPMTISETPPV